MRHGSAALLLPILLIAGCASPPPAPLYPRQGAFGAEQSFTGVLVLSFERQSFEECWLDLHGSAGSDLARLAPSPALADQRAAYVADVTLTGRRRNMVDVTDGNFRGQGFGHLGMYPCLIEAVRITAARVQ